MFLVGAASPFSRCCRPLGCLRSPTDPGCHLSALLSTPIVSPSYFSLHPSLRATSADVMTVAEMEVENGARQAMDTEDVDSNSGSSSDDSGEEVEGGPEAMEGSDEKHEESHANPAFSKFMQGFWDLASVDVPVRYVVAVLRHAIAVVHLPKPQSCFSFCCCCCCCCCCCHRRRRRCCCYQYRLWLLLGLSVLVPVCPC